MTTRNPKPGSSPAGPRRHPRNRQAGFALLITVTLLAFIVVLLVGFATYTRIETGVAGNTQRQAQARENALMALNVALGQLQEHAGPDQRVTATAEAFSNVNGTSRYTGVWHSDPAFTDTPAVPLTWLVSGNERRDADGNPEPLAITPGAPGGAASLIELVGRNSTGSTTVNANYIRAPLQPIMVRGLPGAPAGTDIPVGRYAWWVGDQGVKAPVAVADTTNQVTYAPYDSADVRSRIRQQVSLGAGAANAAGEPVFEPRDSSNASLVANDRVAAFNQLSFLRWTSTSSATAKLSTLRSNFHTWSPNNLNVLANTKAGGLRQDLSLAPGLLGEAFAAWANYPAYMESFTAPPAEEAGSGEPAITPTILPAYGSDPIRRRYPIQLESANGVRIAPVLSYFHLLLGVRKQTEESPYEVSIQWAAALWNPYTSGLVPDPDGFVLEISILPGEVIPINAATGTGYDRLRMRDLFGDSIKVALPWADLASTSPQERTWLPGRVYNWTFQPDQLFRRGEVHAGRFDSRSLAASERGLIVTVPTTDPINGNTEFALGLPDRTTIEVHLKRTNGEVLGIYSREFESVATTEPRAARDAGAQLGFIFSLAEGRDTVAAANGWLTTNGRDPRAEALPSEAFVPRDPIPAIPKDSYAEFADRIRQPERLLDRDITNGRSYNEDVPVFELPRRPFLSMGELQHLFLPGVRPFAVGNPWGAGVEINNIPSAQLFDRFFFSGIAAQVAPTTNPAGDVVLPNPLLRMMRKADASKVAPDEFRAAPNAYSSKHLLQAGAFNLNSANATAWAAILRGVRFPALPGFSYLNADPTTGTAADVTTSLQSTDAQFFRFPQSAQEVYKAESGYLQSTPGSEVVSINTHLFRRGMRTLSASQVDALATRIAELIRVKQADSGPFRSLEEFLSPWPVFATVGAPPAEGEEPPRGPARSLLEAAIEDTGTNGTIAEFSSQWLTQGDIMTALAPVLFPRSDTFVIRTYGEAINPAKLNGTNNAALAAAVEGRAWCEAIVQRVPDYFDARVPAETTPEALAAGAVPPDDSTAPPPDEAVGPPAEAYQLSNKFGRRFKIVSFRWLTRSDI